MKPFFLIVIFALLIIPCLGQKSESVNVEFNIDGKQFIKSHFSLRIYLGQEVLKINGRNGRFSIPNKIKTMESMNVELKVGKFDLFFVELPPKCFDNRWVIGIDSPPFEEIKDFPIENSKTPVLLYYIECHPKNAEVFKSFGKTLGVKNAPF